MRKCVKGINKQLNVSMVPFQCETSKRTFCDCFRVKPAIFDLFLALGIASYLGVFYLALVVCLFLFLIIIVKFRPCLPA